MQVFLFGAALHPRVRDALRLGRGVAAEAEGWRAAGRSDGLGAVLVAAPARVAGELLAVEQGHPFFKVMAALGAAPQALDLPSGAATAFGRAEDGPDWRPADGDAAALCAAVVDDLMPLAERYSSAQLQRSLAQLVVRAASRLRAGTEQTPMRVRRGLTAQDVTISDRAHPYLDFFGLEEQHLRFRRFDGRQSAVVKRAAFVSGDAVTVLPYDPVRDRVLVIEQFRFAPFVRGDRRPWSLEPIAGRIDPRETPEVAARREALEEAGLVLDRLVPTGAYYPSPGAVTEYLYSFIGIADLPDTAARIGGLESEDEDIRGVLLDMEGLAALLASGEAQNGPLILSALWLQANRAAFRG